MEARETGAIAKNIVDADVATLNEQSAERLAARFTIWSDTARKATREGLAILRKCETRLRRIAQCAGSQKQGQVAVAGLGCSDILGIHGGEDF